MPSLPTIIPNGRAPVVRVAPDGVRELTMMRLDFPLHVISGSKPRNPHLTKVRNTDNRYWRTQEEVGRVWNGPDFDAGEVNHRQTEFPTRTPRRYIRLKLLRNMNSPERL